MSDLERAIEAIVQRIVRTELEKLGPSLGKARAAKARWEKHGGFAIDIPIEAMRAVVGPLGYKVRRVKVEGTAADSWGQWQLTRDEMGLLIVRDYGHDALNDVAWYCTKEEHAALIDRLWEAWRDAPTAWMDRVQSWGETQTARSAEGLQSVAAAPRTTLPDLI